MAIHKEFVELENDAILADRAALIKERAIALGLVASPTMEAMTVSSCEIKPVSSKKKKMTCCGYLPKSEPKGEHQPPLGRGEKEMALRCHIALYNSRTGRPYSPAVIRSKIKKVEADNLKFKDGDLWEPCCFDNTPKGDARIKGKEVNPNQYARGMKEYK